MKTRKTLRTAASKEPNTRPRADSVERALKVMGDRWSFLILREAFFGVRRFDDIQKNLSCSPNVLTGRLKHLTANGLLKRMPYQERPARYEYRLTEKGSGLYPSIVLLMRWADVWLDKGKGPPLTLVHQTCGCDTHPSLTCDICSKPIVAREVKWRPGPGAGG